MRKSYSEILDKLELDELEKAKKIAEERISKEIAMNQEIEEEVEKQVHLAMLVIGNRLMMDKVHETYYSWIFKGIKKGYSCHIFAMKNKGIESDWEFNDDADRFGVCKKIKLINLDYELINWVKNKLETEGININE